jgi:3-oxoacyl-ACP reductase-like protein
MGIFSNILAKLGFGDKKDEAAKTMPPPATPAAPAAPSAPVPVPAQASTPAAATVPPPKPAISEVDVVAQLSAMAAASKEKLNWRVSIVDLLKLLGLDSSLASRKELATELGCPADKMADSAQMNMWLHKTVLRKLADNGGNIPADLLD